MEAHARNADDVRPESLSVGASYVIDRKRTTIHTAGGSYYSSSGTRVMAYSFNSDGRRTQSTLKLPMEIKAPQH